MCIFNACLPVLSWQRLLLFSSLPGKSHVPELLQEEKRQAAGLLWVWGKSTKEQVAPLSCFESLNTYKDEKYHFFLKAHHFLSFDTIPTCGERITAVENTVADMLFWLKRWLFFFPSCLRPGILGIQGDLEFFLKIFIP